VYYLEYQKNDMRNTKYKILMTGGGTLGSVTPLLNLVEVWRSLRDDVEFSWIGTFKGPEREFVEKMNIDFARITSPKLSRHQPWKWAFIPFHFIISIISSFILIRKDRPDIMISTGAFVSIPIAVVCRLFKIPIWVHQLDVQVGLANKLISYISSGISVTFEESIAGFSGMQCINVGAILPVSDISTIHAKQILGFEDLPVLLVVGGGTGALQINQVMANVADVLVQNWQVVHLTGPGKMIDKLNSFGQGYIAKELVIDEMAYLWAAADLVIVRAGLGTVFDLVKWGKKAIVVPMPNSHQEVNADLLKQASAAKVLNKINGQILLEAVKYFETHKLEGEVMARNMYNFLSRNGAENLILTIEEKLLRIDNS
jgi:UDP-N-acetylglucosamine--N-acetylmuramyl-(pentapeptide) pyrophosphoryl-undecaprenol N-acetylglucosamine transferase